MFLSLDRARALIPVSFVLKLQLNSAGISILFLNEITGMLQERNYLHLVHL